MSIAIAGGAIAVKVTPIALKVLAAGGLVAGGIAKMLDLGLPRSGLTNGPQTGKERGPGAAADTAGQGTLQALANEIREA
jgi:hypothetical protein